MLQQPPLPPRKKRFAPIIGVLFVAVFAFALGVMFGMLRSPATASIQEELQASLSRLAGGEAVTPQTLSQVWTSVQDRYLKGPTEDKKLFYGALGGLVSSLGDPYSVFLDPQMTADFAKELGGTFEGVGAEIGFKGDQLTVIAPLPDSPADRAGLKPADAIVRIGGVDTAGMSLSYAVSLIRGEKGTTVTLDIVRDGKDPFTLEITRDTIIIESVKWRMLDNNIAYIQIVHFDGNVVSSFDQAVREILVKSPSALIVDVRDNPGGYLDAAVHIAGTFLRDAGTTVVIEQFRDSHQEPFLSEESGKLADLPLVVLINKGSASASEILAGALHDHDRAKLVGETTFGKGTVQDIEEFADGSSLKLTVAQWLTPAGTSIEGNGISPDISVPGPSSDQEPDKQLEKAIEVVLTP